MLSPIRVPASEAFLLRARLAHALHQMHRPEYSDLLPAAEFALAGRTLLVHLDCEADPFVGEAFTQAALRAGLPVDAATLGW